MGIGFKELNDKITCSSDVSLSYRHACFFGPTYYNKLQHKALKEFFDLFYPKFSNYLKDETSVCLDIRQDQKNPYFCFYDEDFDIIFCQDFNNEYSLEYRKKCAPLKESFKVKGSSEYCFDYLQQQLCQIGNIVLESV